MATHKHNGSTYYSIGTRTGINNNPQICSDYSMQQRLLRFIRKHTTEGGRIMVDINGQLEEVCIKKDTDIVVWETYRANHDILVKATEFVNSDNIVDVVILMIEQHNKKVR